jgi:hypothetical protein
VICRFRSENRKGFKARLTTPEEIKRREEREVSETVSADTVYFSEKAIKEVEGEG